MLQVSSLAGGGTVSTAQPTMSQPGAAPSVAYSYNQPPVPAPAATQTTAAGAAAAASGGAQKRRFREEKQEDKLPDNLLGYQVRIYTLGRFQKLFTGLML